MVCYVNNKPNLNNEQKGEGGGEKERERGGEGRKGEGQKGQNGNREKSSRAINFICNRKKATLCTRTSVQIHNMFQHFIFLQKMAKGLNHLESVDLSGCEVIHFPSSSRRTTN